MEEIAGKCKILEKIPPLLILKAINEITREETDSILVYKPYEDDKKNEELNLLDSLKEKRMNQWNCFINNMAMNNETKKLRNEIDIIYNSIEITNNNNNNNSFNQYVKSELLNYKLEVLERLNEELKTKRLNILEEQQKAHKKIERINYYDVYIYI